MSRWHTIGLVCLALLLPYRVLEPVLLNGGQTRFAPLQLNSDTRTSNEQWRIAMTALQRDLLGSTSWLSTKRVLLDDIVGGEGMREWWGLRSHSQLRDIKISSLLSWPRIRSGNGLLLGRQIQHQVGTPRFDSALACNSGLKESLDFLAVSWAVLRTDCQSRYVPTDTRVFVEVSPYWRNLSEGRRVTSYPSELSAQASRGSYIAVRLDEFHHWWGNDEKRANQQCGFLVKSCTKTLGMIRGQQVVNPPFDVCQSNCLGTYRLTGKPLIGKMLVVPLNFDDVIRATQGGASLNVRNFAGLVGISSNQLTEGTIYFTIEPDIIMTLRSTAPLAWLVLMLLVFIARKLTPHQVPTR